VSDITNRNIAPSDAPAEKRRWRLTRLQPPSRIGQHDGWSRSLFSVKSKTLQCGLIALAVGFPPATLSAVAWAGDAQALAQGFKDEEPCNGPFDKTRDAKAFAACLKTLEGKAQGNAAAKQSYAAGAGFNAWSVANYLASAVDKDLFPDIPSRAKASKERQFAIKLFDDFRKAQKAQKIADADLAKLAGADLQGLKPVLDYYDGLPKK
jgi:hypothetical protein